MLRATDRGKSYHIRQDELAVLGAEYFIEQYFCDPLYGRNTPERPLLLTVSFNQPHYPYVADPALRRATAVSIFDGVNFMYKKGALKYQWYGAPQSEVLFDLAADPTERENLLPRPGYAEFMEEGRAQAARYGFSVEREE